MPPQAVLALPGLFLLTQNALVLDLVTFNTVYIGNIPLLGPYTGNNNGAKHVVIHKFMYLPPKFMPLSLRQTCFTPCAAWFTVGMAVVQDGQDTSTPTSLNNYKPLLTWLWCACTLQHTRNTTSQVHLVQQLAEAPSSPCPVSQWVLTMTRAATQL